MAEYVDRKLAITEVQSYDNNGWINKPTRKIPEILSSKNVPTADVIERSKYDNLHNLAKSWLEEKKELEKANDELRSKIDKAVEEIESWINSNNRGNADYFIVDKIEEIVKDLKKNIGE